MNIRKKVILSGIVLLLFAGGTFISEMIKSTGHKIATGLFFENFETEKILQISVSDSADGIFLTKSSSGWRVGEKGKLEQYPADESKVNALLDKVMIMRKDQLISENKANHSSLGVVEGKGIEVTLWDQEKEVTHKFYIGNKSKNWRMSNVRVDGNNEVFLVSGSIRFAFKTKLENWRDKAIFSRDIDSIAQIQILDMISLEKVEDFVGSYWVAKYQGDEKRANENNVQRYLSSLGSLTCSDWADNSIPESEWKEEKAPYIMITFKDGSSETITVGKQDPSGRNRFYMKNSGREDLYFVVGSGVQVPFVSFEYLTFDPEAAKAAVDSASVDSTGENQ